MTTDPVEFWENRYGERDRIWSGNANAALVDAVTGLTAGTALDLGCGEGGDSIWLAQQGWRVTGVDLSATALARAREIAAEQHVPADRIDWVAGDLAAWRAPGEFDLISACFLHSPVEFPRTEVLRRAAAAVAPGGHLLIVGHAAFPPWAPNNDEDHGEHEGHGGHSNHEDHGDHEDHSDHGGHVFLSPTEELAELALGDAWETVIAEVRARDAVGPDGQRARLDDTVVLVRRR